MVRYSIQVFFLFYFLVCSKNLLAQEKLNPNGYNIFYYEDNTKASEGHLKNGKPDGFWKTYYPNGSIKSQGNRKNFELDSLWSFFDADGNISLEINYKMGQKHGNKRKFNKGKPVFKENYKNSIKQDSAIYYYDNGGIEKTVIYDEGKKQGRSFSYSKEGIVETVRDYESDFVINEEFVNRTNKRGLKDGIWKSFYKNGKVVLEGRYINNKRNGFFREYSINGKLLNTYKYDDGELVEDIEEFKDIKVKKTYYSNAQVKSDLTLVNGIPNGISRNYNETGEIVSSKIFKNGKLLGDGIVDKKGKKQGEWIEYYISHFINPNDSIRVKRASGSYVNGFKNGDWKYYYENGSLEQKGKFIKGKIHGKWKWYYENGNLLRDEEFIKGKENGVITEYSDSGKVVMKGIYLNGLKEGKWLYYSGDVKEEGEYQEGKKLGPWKMYYKIGTIYYEGEFIDGVENGKHTYFHSNGTVREELNYIMGVKDGLWKKYDENGEVILVLTFINGEETKINGIKIQSENKE